MSFFEDLMNNRDKQIMALSIVFFVLAFPIYFGLAAANADEGAGLNAINMYEVTGEVTYIEIAAGDEFIADGDTTQEGTNDTEKALIRARDIEVF